MIRIVNSAIDQMDLKPLGLGKVKLEWGLHCIAHNMRKLAAVLG